MKWRKNVLKICAWFVICTITGFITASIIAKPINLTQAEIDYYVDTAETIWYEGFDSVEVDDSIYIEYHLKEKEIEVFSTNGNKQSITVNFEESKNLVAVNEPLVNFWGCLIFYGLIFGTVIYQIITFTILLVKERKKSRR